VVVMHDPTWLHNTVQSGILFALSLWANAAPERGAVGLPLDVLLDERNVFSPDVVWYAHGRVPALHDPRPYPMPDIAIEVRSPSTWRFDLGAKKSGYERHALPELWLADTAANALLVFRRSSPRQERFDIALELRPGDVLRSPLLAGFELPLADLFSDA
ncbi:MAG: Uma2 family endonuclease, partial [Thermoleophilaceae bacterium]|nr:Uma2 family endonuclease [Thermoleophilaceae bacterium]